MSWPVRLTGEYIEFHSKYRQYFARSAGSAERFYPPRDQIGMRRRRTCYPERFCFTHGGATGNIGDDPNIDAITVPSGIDDFEQIRAEGC